MPETAGDQSSRELLDEAVRLRWYIERMEARLLDQIAEIDRRSAYQDDGAVTIVGWLKNQGRMDASRASQLVTLARAGETFPELRDAQREGRISGCEARRIAHGTEKYRRDLDRRGEHGESAVEATGNLCRTLLESAENGAGTAALRQQIDSHRHQLAADSMTIDEWAAFQQRELYLYTTFDGMISVRGTLDPSSAATVRAAIDSLSKPTTSDQLTSGQRQADALVQLAKNALDSGEVPTNGGQRAHVHILVSADTLAAQRDGSGTPPATLEGHGPVSAETARLFACDGEATRIVHGPDSEVLDLGRAARCVSPALHKALRFRDGGCAYPHCDRPVEWCDAHHIEHWSAGGTTSLDNLVLLCRRHHTEVHLKGIKLTLEDGVLRIELPQNGNDPPSEHPGEHNDDIGGAQA